MKPAIFLFSLSFSTTLLAGLSPQDFKLGCRQEIIDRASNQRNFKLTSPIKESDRAEHLIDHPEKMVRNVKEMEKQKLISGQSTVVPWSDTYWPLYKGGLGQRYNDEKTFSLEWNEAFEYVQKNPAAKLVEQGKWDKLSPSEKYDMLMGLKNMPLTQVSWAEGKEYFDQDGKVESWMGLCHGWAPASMMMAEPKKKVELTTTLGQVTLYPSDIKGLVTMLWAKGDFQSRFIGGRCNSKKPRTANGRMTENDCLDNNPGTWHMVVVNQLGISKRPFIMDANSGYEVWNHPVYAYEYTYFNPKTNKPVKKLTDAMAETGSWQDPRAKYRSPGTKYVLGVYMTVSYVLENEATTEEDQESVTTQKYYEYDLELNDKFEIIGGEWITDVHPDFLWVPEQTAFPVTQGDTGADEVDFSVISPELRENAYFNATYGLPWGPAVRNLVKRSAVSNL